MQISQKQGGWPKSHEKRPIRLEREYVFNHIRKVNCGRNLKGIGRPRPVAPARFSLTMTLNLLITTILMLKFVIIVKSNKD